MSRGPSGSVVVSSEQEYGLVVTVQASLQVPAPAGEVCSRTDAIPRSDAAVAVRATVPRRLAPGSASVTATLLKSAAVANLCDGFALEATNVAPVAPTFSGPSTARIARASQASFTRAPLPPRGRPRAIGRRRSRGRSAAPGGRPRSCAAGG